MVSVATEQLTTQSTILCLTKSKSKRRDYHNQYSNLEKRGCPQKNSKEFCHICENAIELLMY
jgi:hypothetical protein